MTYEQQLQHLLGLGIPQDEIFTYDDSPHSQEFEYIFSFYQETITNHPLLAGLEVNIFFVNELGVNARAGFINGEYVIGIYAGLVVDSILKIEQNEGLESDTEIAALAEGYKPPLSRVFHEFSVHFTFYHELAHVIQGLQNGELTLYERLDEAAEYSEARHILEMDADEYGAICCAEHLMHSMFGIFNPVDQVLVERYLILGGVVSFIKIMEFSGAQDELYFEAKSHPHPLVRFTNVVSVMIRYVEALDYMKESEISLDPSNIIRKSLEAMLVVEPKLNDFPSSADRYLEIISDEDSREQILLYFAKWLDHQRARKDLAVVKRNYELAKQKK